MPQQLGRVGREEAGEKGQESEANTPRLGRKWLRNVSNDSGYSLSPQGTEEDSLYSPASKRCREMSSADEQSPAPVMQDQQSPMAVNEFNNTVLPMPETNVLHHDEGNTFHEMMPVVPAFTQNFQFDSYLEDLLATTDGGPSGPAGEQDSEGDSVAGAFDTLVLPEIADDSDDQDSSEGFVTDGPKDLARVPASREEDCTLETHDDHQSISNSKMEEVVVATKEEKEKFQDCSTTENQDDANEEDNLVVGATGQNKDQEENDISKLCSILQQSHLDTSEDVSVGLCHNSQHFWLLSFLFGIAIIMMYEISCRL